MKKMLIVYPNNFLQGAQGTNSRVGQLIYAFRELGFQIDYLGYENFSPHATFVNFEQQDTENLINKLYVYDFQTGYARNHKKTVNFFDRVKRKLRKFKPERNPQYLQDWAPEGTCRLFKDITEENNYDVIILFYTYLANLLKDCNIASKKVYFMEDSMFLQQYSWGTGGNPDITLGKLIDEETNRIKYFDEVFCISYDEKIMYEKLTGKTMHFLPHLQPENVAKVTTPLENRRWDIMFIGFNNPFNVEGLNWFVKEVYPLLNSNVRLVFVGSATDELEATYSNFDIIPFAPDLDEIFSNVKISVCPMFRGTGMKIKVVESMARGIPVVCNERGVDGFPDKMECGCLVTQIPAEFAEYINRLLTDNEFYLKTVERTCEYYDNLFARGKYISLLKDKLI